MTIEPPSLNRVSFLVEENKRSRGSERRVKEYHENLATTLWNHTRAVAFLQASFEVFNKWADHQTSNITLEALAKKRHEIMAPYDHISKGMDKWGRRSDDRTHFCEGIAYRAEEISDRLIECEDWQRAFYDDRDSQVRFALETNNGLTACCPKCMEVSCGQWHSSLKICHLLSSIIRFTTKNCLQLSAALKSGSRK